MRGLMLGVVAALTMTAASAEEKNDLGVRFHGVVVHVADMEEALDFYSGLIGFDVDEAVSDKLARLESETPFFLLQTGEARPVTAENARTTFGFQTSDIEARIAEWRAAGVEFTSKTPEKVGVGRAIRFRDPFGAIHYLLQQEVGEPAPVAEPVIYNVGFNHTDAIAAQGLYVDLLGFVVRSMNYYPPAIPLGHADGSFAFMLHKAAAAPADDAQYASGTGAVAVFSAPDLAPVRRTLEQSGVELVTPAEAPGLPYERLAFRDGEGVVSEIWEIP